MTPNTHYAEMWRKKDWLWIALISLALQAFWAMRLPQPSYMDAYYYTTNGQRLAEGYGFTEMIIWQFLDQPAGLPAPSHTYWMPLPSLLAAAGYKLIANFRGAQLPFWLLAGVLPVLSFVISLQLSAPRWQAWTAALLTASGGFYNTFFNQPSTFAPFAWTGGLCLLTLGWASPLSWTNGRWAMFCWTLAGILAGLAHLARADGVLFLVVGAVVWWLEIRRLKFKLPTTRQSPIAMILLFLAGYLLIMGGWFTRNWLVVGRPLSIAGTQTVFLTTYDDLFAYNRSFDLSHFLDWGWANILYSRLEGISLAGQTFVAVSCLIFLTPLVLWSWLALGRRSAKEVLLRPMTWYALALFASMSLVFTFPGGRGGLFHSSAALWPWFMALAAAGIGLAVDRMAVHLSHWRPERAKRIFSALFIGVAFVMSFALGLMREPESNHSIIYRQIAARLPATAVVMVGDAPQFYYHTRLAAVSVPNEPVEVLLQAAERYHVTYLILDRDRPSPLATLYSGELESSRIRLIEDFAGLRLYRLLEFGECGY